MTATAATEQKPLRWSSVRSCPRKAVYEAEGAPSREVTDRETRVMWRGRSVERDYVDHLERQYGADAIERQVEIVWGNDWVGHADAYLRPVKTLVEILSSVHATPDMIHSKLLQLVGYMEHHPKAEQGVLIVVDPADYSEDRYPLVKTSRLYQELAAEMRQRIHEVTAWADTGELPERVCAKPSDARQHFCRHADHCFSSWTAPPADDLGDDLDLIEAATELWRIDQQRKQAKATLAALDRERQLVLDDIDDRVPAGKHRAGPVQILRTLVQRRPTVNWQKADAAGIEIPHEILNDGSSYSTWRVELVDATNGNDYGIEPPF